MKRFLETVANAESSGPGERCRQLAVNNKEGPKGLGLVGASASGLQLLGGSGALAACISAGTEETAASSRRRHDGGGEKQTFVWENT